MRSIRPAAAALAVAALLAGCVGPSGSDDLGRVEAATEEPTQDEGGSSSQSTPPECDPAQSYDPLSPLPGPDALPSGSSMAEIRSSGALVVGVSADTLLLGARNPFSGEIEGFDIDVLRDVATAIFGTDDALQFRVITSGQRIEVLQSGEVDLVARAFTATCSRWQEIAFSSIYYVAGQKVLVSSDSDAQSLEDLTGQRVCAPAGTTTLSRLEGYDLEAVPAATHTECLAMFQQGEVDAITGDDTILAGFAAQDPYAQVVGDAISSEPYGVGVAADRVDLVQFVNAVLAGRAADGRWQTSYDTWLAPALGAGTGSPTPTYGRTG